MYSVKQRNPNVTLMSSLYCTLFLYTNISKEKEYIKNRQIKLLFLPYQTNSISTNSTFVITLLIYRT